MNEEMKTIKRRDLLLLCTCTRTYALKKEDSWLEAREREPCQQHTNDDDEDVKGNQRVVRRSFAIVVSSVVLFRREIGLLLVRKMSVKTSRTLTMKSSVVPRFTQDSCTMMYYSWLI